MTTDLASAFAAAVAAKDADALRGLLDPEVDFRGMTPGRVWDDPGVEGVVDTVGTWFEPDDVVEGVESIETDAFADRQRVGYRLRVRNKDGLHLVEQQAYLSELDGRIGWLRVMCSGYRPVTEDLQPDQSRTPRLRAPSTP
ncbi:MAG TPA: hypothetical protein VMI11_15460 [Actinomycetes bacterium]|nr:hypothetical protein [Actinomycetes bacterium]